MNNKLLKKASLVSKYTIIGAFLQVFLIGTLLASEPRAQKDALSEIYLSLDVRDQKIGDALQLISEKTGFDFIYNGTTLNLDKKITIAARKKELYSILLDISKAANVQFKRVNNSIYVKEKEGREQNIIEVIDIQGQSRNITGRVVSSEDGEPLPGVNVIEKGTSNGNVSDVNGRYSLVVSEGATLVFSSVGFITEEVIIGDRIVIDLVLTQDIKQLQELVVIGYGVQEKVNITGAVSAIKIDEQMTSRAITNVSTGLSGLMPGLTATQTSGMAGNDGASLLIRGLGSPNNSSPLIVVDGVPDVDINKLNINDIESVSVLKDAASASVYGSRGANGVILITTKRGEAGQKMKLNYSGYQSWRSFTNYYESMSDYPLYMTLHNTSLMNGGGSALFLDGTIDQWMAMGKIDPIRFPNTDWWDVLFKTGNVMSHSLSAQGGSEMINYFVSIGSMDDSGVSVNTGYNRKNFRSNIDAKLTDVIKVGVNLDGSWADQHFGYDDGVNTMGQSNIRWDIVKNSPGVAVLDEQGRYGGNMAYREHSANRNMYATMVNRHTNVKLQDYNGNIYGQWEALKGLMFRIDYGLNTQYRFSNNYNTPFLQYNFQTDQVLNTITSYGGISNNYSQNYKTLFQGRVNYNIKDILKGHSLSLMGVYTEEYWHGQNMSGSRNDRIHPGLYEIDAALLERPPSASGSSYDEGLRSWIGRMNYNINDKYLLETNLRADASSKFLKGYEWGIFPSFSAAWRISQEGFFKDITTITDAKIRGSWGSLGNNSGVSRYEQRDTYNLTNYSFGQGLSQGVSTSKMINPDFSWEKTKVTNLGLDVTFFQKLDAEIDVYNRLTSDIIRPSELSTILSGFSAPRMNIGELQNRGIETNITWRDNIGDVQYRVRFNYSYNKNKLLSWNQRLGYGVPFLGYPYSFTRTYKATGLAQTWEDIYNAPYQGSNFMAPGDILYEDVNGDGQITGDDMVALRDSPRSFFNNQYGLIVDGNWKNFDINIQLQASSGSKDFWYDYYNMPYPNSSRYTYNQVHLDHWNLDNRYPVLPRLVIGSGGQNARESTYWLYKRDYIRFKNLQVGYNIPESLVRILNLSSVRCYFTGENLFTITQWPGIDPEKPGGDGRELSNPYPLTQSFAFGINVSL